MALFGRATPTKEKNMPGAGLSRWTLSYFAVALICLIGAEALMAAGFGYPVAALEAPETLLLVHLTTIGWLSLLMSGALLQFVPVLVAKPLQWSALSPVALLLIMTGLAALLSGFASMAGMIALPGEVLPAGGLVVVVGLGAMTATLARTLWTARPLTLPAKFVIAGLASLAGTVALGETFALTIAGLLGGEQALSLLTHGVPLHALLGLGGWMTFTAMGVSYRLLAMFMLAPEIERFSTRLVLYAGIVTLIVVAAAVPFAVAATAGLPAMLLIACSTGLGALALYGRDIVTLYRQRKRRAIELNAYAATGAFAALAGAAIALLVLLVSGQLSAHIGALAYLFVFGWLSGLALSKLYKIIAFMTWLECFAPVLGKRQTPRVQDLVDEPVATPWFGAYYAAAGFAALTLLVDLPIAFRLFVGVQLFATLAIARHFYRTRMLCNVPAELRHGIGMPRLFLPGPVVRRP